VSSKVSVVYCYTVGRLYLISFVFMVNNEFMHWHS
jgi:hypothetical protein